MSSSHSGNLLNSITFEEHSGELNAKKVSLVSGATIYAVVNTASGGNVTVQQGTTPWVTSQQGNVTLSDAKTYIGLVTATSIQGTSPWVSSIVGNVTISDSKGYIGLVTVTQASSARTITGNLTLSDPKGYIGLITIGGGLSNVAVIGNVTLSGTANVAVLGNLTLTDSKGFIGLVTVVQSSSSRSLVGNLTIDSGNISIKGNITISGTSNVAVIGNVTLSDPKTYIGLVTATSIQGTSPWSSSIVGNLTLSDPKGFIGLVTVTGIVALSQSGADNDIQVVGNVTLSDSKNFIGLVTAVQAYGSNSTILTGIISSTGFTTIATPPSNTRFFIKNLHVSSLGRSEVELRSGATAIIPFTSLSTTSGFAAHYGELGLPLRAQNDTLVWNLNGGATVSYMINVRSES